MPPRSGSVMAIFSRASAGDSSSARAVLACLGELVKQLRRLTASRSSQHDHQAIQPPGCLRNTPDPWDVMPDG